MMEFGKTLRAAREAKGYTVSQVAEMTRLMSSVIEGFEAENFSMIAAPIYGRGFVKLYCEVLGLDPKPFVSEFMEIYNGNRDLGIKERPVSAPPPVPEPAPEPVASEPPVSAFLSPAAGEATASPPPPADLFGDASGSRYAAAEPPAPPAAKPQSAEPAVEHDREQSDESQRLSRYAAPIREYKPRVSVSLPRNFWRIAFLALVALGVVWMICLGMRALYRATSTGEATAARTSAESLNVPAAAKAKEAPKAKPKPDEKEKSREKIDIPPLYID